MDNQQIVDLSLPIDDEAYEVHPLRIERTTHAQGVEKLNQVMLSRQPFGKLKYLLGKRIVKKEDLPEEEFLSLEMVYSSVHSGTHLDYSYHYGSKCEGRDSKPAEDIPLWLCYQNGVKLDFCAKKPDEFISAKDVETALEKINYQLKPNDIVLFYTGSDKLFTTQKYFTHYPGVDPTAIDYLLDRGIKIFGVDTMGIDRPYRFMMKEFLDTGNACALWPAHFHGRKREFIHIERLANLSSLPDYGFKIMCFPVKIKRTGAAWARVVALVGSEAPAKGGTNSDRR
ncbi:MAG: cyclase family protein [Candidatus Omnitrophica bacterium]|nr:cyclase family protein [Candidatus Omnitrophota bacterium]